MECDILYEEDINNGKKGVKALQYKRDWVIILDKSPADVRFKEGKAKFGLEEVKQMALHKSVPVGSIFKHERTGEFIRVTRNGFYRTTKKGRKK